MKGSNGEEAEDRNREGHGEKLKNAKNTQWKKESIINVAGPTGSLYVVRVRGRE